MRRRGFAKGSNCRGLNRYPTAKQPQSDGLRSRFGRYGAVNWAGRLARERERIGSGCGSPPTPASLARARAALSARPQLRLTLEFIGQNERTPRGILSGFSVNWAVTYFRNR